MSTGSKTIDVRAQRDSRILDAEAWRDSDGYWLPLAPGYKCGLSDCHTIHERSVHDVLKAIRCIECCACDDCLAHMHDL